MDLISFNWIFVSISIYFFKAMKSSKLCQKIIVLRLRKPLRKSYSNKTQSFKTCAWMKPCEKSIICLLWLHNCIVTHLFSLLKQQCCWHLNQSLRNANDFLNSLGFSKNCLNDLIVKSEFIYKTLFFHRNRNSLFWFVLDQHFKSLSSNIFLNNI